MLIFLAQSAFSGDIPESSRSLKVTSAQTPLLQSRLKAKGLTFGAAVFIRIFKQASTLELWLQGDSGEFTLFEQYPICDYSGRLGPKLKQGDQQSPEGFYFVKPQQLNPWSSFHLSFNLGYPNAYDRHHGRSGSALMVHGDCVSIGCYAMTDPGIDEIYTLIDAALRAGQPFFRVQAFPFRLTNKALDTHSESEWRDFWLNLKEGYDYFEHHKKPPNVELRNGRYVFD
ncbi:MAG: murein L,D-transpeptidase YafK [Flavobacteriales bacterium]|jgi:murein L,D-transpeptidase YafK